MINSKRATQAAMAMVSKVYRIANSNKNGVVWGFNVKTKSGYVVNEVGAYQDAVRMRRDNIAELARKMTEEAVYLPPIPSDPPANFGLSVNDIEDIEAQMRRSAEAREREYLREKTSRNAR